MTVRRLPGGSIVDDYGMRVQVVVNDDLTPVGGGGGSLSAIDDGTVDTDKPSVPAGIYDSATSTTRAVSDANPMPVTGALSTTEPIQVAGGGIVLPLTVTIDTIGYSIGDVFGVCGGTTTDGWKLTDALSDGGSGLITGISMFSIENIKPTGTIFVFSENPSASFQNNTAAPSWSSGDDAKCIGIIPITSTYWVSYSSTRAIYTQGNMTVPVRCSTGKDLYMVFVLDNAPDFSAATVFYAYIGIGQF